MLEKTLESPLDCQGNVSTCEFGGVINSQVHLVKAMVFPVVMYGCESWTIKKAECQRIDAFELWCEKTLERPLDYKAIKLLNPKRNQS